MEPTQQSVVLPIFHSFEGNVLDDAWRIVIKIYTCTTHTMHTHMRTHTHIHTGVCGAVRTCMA